MIDREEWEATADHVLMRHQGLMNAVGLVGIPAEISHGEVAKAPPRHYPATPLPCEPCEPLASSGVGSISRGRSCTPSRPETTQIEMEVQLMAAGEVSLKEVADVETSEEE